MNLKGGFSGPDQALQCVRFAAACAPASIGAVDEQRTVACELQRHRAAFKAGSERIAGTLIFTLHLFHRDAHDGAVGLVADEELLAKGTKLSARLIAG